MAEESKAPQPNDQEQASAILAWEALLGGIKKLARDNGLSKKIFISYAWPPAGSERNALQAFLKRLQDDLKGAGMDVFLDIRRMQGDMEALMQQELTDSDFVIPILTPGFLARLQEQNPNNLQFEFSLMMQKVALRPASVLPILQAGGFSQVVLQEPLKPLAKHMVYTIQTMSDLPTWLTGLSDPLGLIPVIYGIPYDDLIYRDLVLTWLENGLNRLPSPVPNAILRQAQMAQLFLPQGQSPQCSLPSIQVIQGIAGVGKTQLAATYAEQHRCEKAFVCWIQADNVHLGSEWLRLGVPLGLDLNGLPPEEQKRRIRFELSRKSNWLIVLDNLESLDTLQGLFPEDPWSGQVLITTRSKNWGAHPVLHVAPFTPRESAIYFVQNVVEDHLLEGAEGLAQALGHLPLALSHAVWYMQGTRRSAREYHELYQQQGIELLAAVFDEKASDPNRGFTVLAAYQASLHQLMEQHPQAGELVRYCAYLGSEGLQPWLLQALLNIDGLTYGKCITQIHRYGLLTDGRGGLSMHPLVQAAIRAGQADEIPTQIMQRLTTLKSQIADFEKEQLLQTHLRAVQSHLAPRRVAQPQLQAPLQPESIAMGNDVEIGVLEAKRQKLRQKLEQAPDTLFGRTAIQDDPDYIAVRNKEELTVRIQALEVFEAKYQVNFAKRMPMECDCLKECRAVKKELDGIEKEMREVMGKLRQARGLPEVEEKIQAFDAVVGTGAQIGVDVQGQGGNVRSDISANRATATDQAQIGGMYLLPVLQGGAAGRGVGLEINERVVADGASAAGQGSQIGSHVQGEEGAAGSVQSNIDASGANVSGGGRIGGHYHFG